MGPTVLFPSQNIQRKIYGLADDRQSADNHLPSTLQRISAPTISKRNLFYNPAEAKQIELLERMLRPGAFKKYQRTSLAQGEAPGLTVLLAGGPGTGKTELARQLAKKTGRDLLLFNAAEQRDKFYGESEKRIQRVFDAYADLVRSNRQVPILFFNEGDSVFQSRQNNGSSTCSSENTVQTILLNELERFHGILFCTTNRPDSFDEAFSRRFLVQIMINSPLPAVRLQLLSHLFPDLPIATAETLAADHAFTAADLINFRKLRCMQSIVHLDQTTLAEALQLHLHGLKKDKGGTIGFKM
jgi:SpoVK/Ycf46/Vps4 family AAA+-type ATPase